MSKICPKCHQTYTKGKYCLDCGIPLVDEQPSVPQSSSDFKLNLGDANAISGGVNMSDSHSVSNNTVNTTTSNVDSHNVITNNITQVEREKTPEELKHEKELAYREECLKVYSNGIMTSEGKRKLDDLQYRLGLDESSANKILSDVAKRSERKSSSLSPVHQITYNNIRTAIIANRLDMVNRLMAQMKAMVQRYSAEEIQFTYYMLQAVLHPKECTEEYESHYEDKYWQTFWSSIAYRRLGNIEKSELLVADVGDKWTDTIPQENVFVLASVNALIDKDIDTAKSLFDNISGEHSPYLTNLTTCLYTLLYGDMLSSEELKQMQKDSVFYTSNLFAEISTYNSEQRRLQAEAEAKRIAEEKKKQEEAEAKRIAEEKKRREEAKRIAEEKKKQEEAEAKRVAEEKKKQEEAEAKRIAEEKKKQEEAEAKRIAEEKKKQEEAEAKRVAEEKKQKAEAEILYNAADTNSDPAKLMELRKAAEAGDIWSMFYYAQLYHLSNNVEKDYELSIIYYTKAAEAGNAWAMNNLGECYEDGNGVDQDYEEAVNWYRKAAEAGNALAMNNLGNCYEDGNGVKQEKAVAVKWYREAAEAGNASAMNNLGRCYEDGNGVTQEKAVAVKWYREAAEAGNASAMNNLGRCYEIGGGNGIKKNIKEAINWYRKAAEAGNALAMNNLGNCYIDGNGVKQDYAKALIWFTKGAKAGDSAAMANIGWCYEFGKGVKKNPVEAMNWYQKALDSGYIIDNWISKRMDGCKKKLPQEKVPTGAICKIKRVWADQNKDNSIVIHFHFSVQNHKGKKLKLKFVTESLTPNSTFNNRARLLTYNKFVTPINDDCVWSDYDYYINQPDIKSNLKYGNGWLLKTEMTVFDVNEEKLGSAWVQYTTNHEYRLFRKDKLTLIL